MCIVTSIVSVRPLGNNLSVVTVEGVEHQVVANRREDGSFRWREGEVCVYVPEGAVVPDDVLKERGYWDDERGRGLLEGKQKNRVKMRRFGPEEDRVESRGLLFKTVRGNTGATAEYALDITRGDERLRVNEGDDVAEFLGITAA